MKKTVSQKLAENLKYFVSNTDRRCSKGGNCRYDGATLGLKTKGCFVGALMQKKDRAKADSLRIMGISTLIRNGNEGKFKVPKIISENKVLMGHFQEFHDSSQNWDTNELSLKGKMELSGIIDNNSDVLNVEDFKEFL